MPPSWSSLAKTVITRLSIAVVDGPKQVAVVVIDGELPHAVFEVFDRLAYARSVFQPLPETVHVVCIEV
jgi:hypothetical protein